MHSPNSSWAASNSRGSRTLNSSGNWLEGEDESFIRSSSSMIREPSLGPTAGEGDDGCWLLSQKEILLARSTSKPVLSRPTRTGASTSMEPTAFLLEENRGGLGPLGVSSPSAQCVSSPVHVSAHSIHAAPTTPTGATQAPLMQRGTNTPTSGHVALSVSPRPMSVSPAPTPLSLATTTSHPTSNTISSTVLHANGKGVSHAEMDQPQKSKPVGRTNQQTHSTASGHTTARSTTAGSASARGKTNHDDVEKSAVLNPQAQPQAALSLRISQSPVPKERGVHEPSPEPIPVLQMPDLMPIHQGGKSQPSSPRAKVPQLVTGHLTQGTNSHTQARRPISPRVGSKNSSLTTHPSFKAAKRESAAEREPTPVSKTDSDTTSTMMTVETRPQPSNEVCPTPPPRAPVVAGVVMQEQGRVADALDESPVFRLEESPVPQVAAGTVPQDSDLQLHENLGRILLAAEPNPTVETPVSSATCEPADLPQPAVTGKVSQESEMELAGAAPATSLSETPVAATTNAKESVTAVDDAAATQHPTLAAAVPCSTSIDHELPSIAPATVPTTHFSIETQTDQVVILSAAEYEEFKRWKEKGVKSDQSPPPPIEESTSTEKGATVAVNTGATKSSPPSQEMPPAGLPLAKGAKTDAGCCSMM